MASPHSLTATATGGVGAVREHQTTIFERLKEIHAKVERHDPVAPSVAIFCCVLALSALGMLVQASHAATTLAPAEFTSELLEQVLFRTGGVAVMLIAARIGTAGVRRYIPALMVAMFVLLGLVFVPGIGSQINGSHRWIDLVVVKFQPSELARIVLVVWVADRCTKLGPLVTDWRKGVVPVLGVIFLYAGMVAIETDFGGASLLFLCAAATLWIGGAHTRHVFMPLSVAGMSLMVVGFTLIPYIRKRILMFFGTHNNQQVTDAKSAIASGDLFGVGYAHGPLRNHGVPYLESDFVFAQVGEELGFFGMLLVIGLFVALLWYGLRLVLSIKDRFDALATFGLMISTCLQGMLHVQIVAGLAPPKGMTLPFLSHGGTSLIVSSLGVGLALGAARRWSMEREQVVTGP